MYTCSEKIIDSIEGATDEVIAVWDEGTANLSVGSILILLEELSMLSSLLKAKLSTLCFVGGEHSEFYDSKVEFIKLSADLDNCPNLLKMSVHNSDVDNVYVCSTWESFETFLNERIGKVFVWPSRKEIAKGNYKYGTTLYVQSLYNRLGWLPSLSCSRVSNEWAVRFIKERSRGNIAVSVHLKNASDVKNESNANFKAWEKFFRVAGKFNDVDFFLVGSDPIPDQFRSIPGVIIVQDNGGNLYRDLAIINRSSGFMGMASGPCLIAIFSSKPYVIFKNPNHHREDMIHEIGDANRYCFSNPTQSLLRCDDNSQKILEEFDKIHKSMIENACNNMVKGIDMRC